MFDGNKVVSLAGIKFVHNPYAQEQEESPSIFGRPKWHDPYAGLDRIMRFGNEAAFKFFEKLQSILSLPLFFFFF